MQELTVADGSKIIQRDEKESRRAKCPNPEGGRGTKTGPRD